MLSGNWRQFWFGVQAELPILIGVAPFGMIYGVLALNAGLGAGSAQAMSAIVFAGSSQFVTTQLIPLGTPGLVIILTVWVVNLRHALYSASIAPYLVKLRPAWKWLLAYLLTDEAYAVAITHYRESAGESEGNQLEAHSHWFFLGAGLALWITWQISTAAGIFLGAVVPESWSLEFTLALTFIALMIPNVKDWSGLGAALSAGIVALAANSLPYKSGLILAALAGILVGLALEKRS